MPKLYLADVGLAAALLGLRSAEQAQAQPLRGALFQTLVVNESLKARWNGGERSMLTCWRDHVGTEVDLVLERGNELGQPTPAAPVAGSRERSPSGSVRPLREPASHALAKAET